MKKYAFILLLILPVMISCGSDDKPDYEAESQKREQWLQGQWSDKKDKGDVDSYEVWKFKKNSAYEWYVKPRGKEGIRLVEKGTYEVKRVNNYYVLFLKSDLNETYEYKFTMTDNAKFSIPDVTFYPDNAEYEIIRE